MAVILLIIVFACALRVCDAVPSREDDELRVAVPPATLQTGGTRKDGECLTLQEETDSTLLQYPARRSRPVAASTAPLQPSTQCSLFPAYQPLREPPVLRSPVTLTVETTRLCFPSRINAASWTTRAYGAPGMLPMVPGPTIHVKPGELLEILVVNKLEPPSPDCKDARASQNGVELLFSANGFCHVNATNLHTHGLHVTPKPGGDDIFETAQPGRNLSITLQVPSNHMGGTFWYHPHHHHATADQAGGGLHGAIIMEDESGSVPEEVANMPNKTLVLSLVDLRFPILGPSGSLTGGTSPRIEYWSLGHLWRNEDGEPVSRNAVFSLVNAMWIPSLTVRAGEWTRLRFVFASIELSLVLWPPTSDGSEGGLDCEWKLLAKDGIYLNVVPRDIQKVYLAPGQRSDVALRCRCASPRAPCGGSVVSGAELAGPTAQDGPAQRRRQRPDEPHTRLERGTRGPFLGETTLEQELFRVEVRPADRAAAVPRPLRPFRARRPCYLVDLRRARVPRRNRGQLLFPNPGLPLTYAGRRWPVVLWSDRIDMRKNANPWPWAYVGRPMRHEHLQPPLHVMRGASVQEFYVRGPGPNDGLSYHPVHIHVSPFQIQKFNCEDGSWVGPVAKDCGDNTSDPYFQTGDWHDTFLYPAGQAVLRSQFSTFTGRYVLHCHVLAHEDMGMMAYFKVTGKEGATWPGAKKLDPHCYSDGSGVGYSWA
uniref:Plastocyanin-like domain-containing protein n=1 Tax=Pyrodinium bahamense TaxID=73915 RepID=A0A7R9ZWL6_9DINO